MLEFIFEVLICGACALGAIGSAILRLNGYPVVFWGTVCLGFSFFTVREVKKTLAYRREMKVL